MSAIKFSQDLRPMSDLKSQGAEIVRQVNETRRPVVLTRHGRGVAVVISLEEYEEYQATRARRELQLAVQEAEQELERGQGISHESMKSKLREWAGD